MQHLNVPLQVVQVFQEPGNMGKVLPDYLSEWTTEKVCRIFLKKHLSHFTAKLTVALFD